MPAAIRLAGCYLAVMRGLFVILLLLAGWAGMYFLLMGAVPKHQRKQTDSMPGTRKSAPLVEETVPAQIGPLAPDAGEKPPAGGVVGADEPAPGSGAAPGSEPTAPTGPSGPLPR